MPKPAAAATGTLELDSLLVRIAADYPQLSFVEGAQFAWHSGRGRVAYHKAGQNTTHAMLSLLHELGHAILDHKDYSHDIELLQIEVATWDRARTLAAHYGVETDEDYIQDCLDTYRDWLHLRATCPTCFSRSLQASRSQYRCHNCQTEWTVTRSRLCRPYRLRSMPVTA